MKIGIVTLYDDNFGTCLQAFALQNTLNKLGHDAYIIPYVRTKISNQTSGVKLSRLAAVKKIGFLGLIKYLFSYRFISQRKAVFSLFKKDKLVFFDKKYFRGDDLSVLNKEFDKFVCGSDMLWSEEFYEDWEFFYLGFSEKNRNIAYAPSFGKNEIAKENRAKLIELLNNIYHLSCREDAGVDLIKNIAGLSVPQVLDPTLLLTRDEWDGVIDDENAILREKYALVYVFGGVRGARKDFFDKFNKYIGTKVVVLPMNFRDDKSHLPAIGPIEYLKLFRSAEFIVTDTFHGMIFSIIFNKQFLVLNREDGGHWAKYSDRMTSTLKMLCLESRYVSNSFDSFNELNKIDYSEINKLLDEKRTASIDFLKNSLGDI